MLGTAQNRDQMYTYNYVDYEIIPTKLSYMFPSVLSAVQLYEEAPSAVVMHSQLSPSPSGPLSQHALTSQQISTRSSSQNKSEVIMNTPLNSCFHSCPSLLTWFTLSQRKQLPGHSCIYSWSLPAPNLDPGIIHQSRHLIVFTNGSFTPAHKYSLVAPIKYKPFQALHASLAFASEVSFLL